MIWTAEKISELKHLFVVQGLNFRQIAAKWDVGIGVIAGKCHRLKLKRGRTNETARRGELRVKQPVAPREIKVTKLKAKPVVKTPPKKPVVKKPVAKAKVTPPPVVLASVVILTPPKEFEPIPFEQLQSHHCHWPTNDVRPFVYCGKRNSGAKPYCDDHLKRMYVPDKPRIRYSGQ